MIDEMMLGFDSPGNVSTFFIIALLPADRKICEGQIRGHKRRKCAARVLCAMLACAPNWLAAESVTAAMAAASLQYESARAMPMPNNERKPRTRLSLSAVHIECHKPLPCVRHVCQDVGGN